MNINWLLIYFIISHNKIVFSVSILNFLVFSVSCFGQTNVYHPFPDSSVMWRVDEIDSSFPNGWANSYYQIYIEGDTIAANGKSYHKLYFFS